MRYLGGKSRLGGQIVAAMLKDLGTTRFSHSVDLCAGAGGVTHRLADVSDTVTAVEMHPGLVALHRAVQDGWVPPEHVSEEEYHMLRATNDHTNPLTAFVEFACSFGGKSWGGYARQPSTGYNFARGGSRSILKRARKNVTFLNQDALAWEPSASGLVVYCDPPYEGTTSYRVGQDVAPHGWWLKCQELVRSGTCVF